MSYFNIVINSISDDVSTKTTIFKPATGRAYFLESILIAITHTGDVDFSLLIQETRKDGTSTGELTYLCKDIVIPHKSSVELIQNRHLVQYLLNVENHDELYAYSSVEDGVNLVITMSLMEE